jgi:hypothetical protein
VEDVSIGLIVQLVGAGLLFVAVLTHVAEHFDLLPWMGWGLPHSAGHYVDLVSVVSGIALVGAGTVFRVVTALRLRGQADADT